MANLCNPISYEKAARIVVNSIIQKPQYFAGYVGRYDTNLISASAGTIISKCGAEGLFALGWPSKGIGLAIKVADGNRRAAPPVIVSIIEQLGLASA
jgi:L-asparaginase II